MVVEIILHKWLEAFSFALLTIKMQHAKIHLSSQQIKLVTNAEFILTKNAILEEIKATLADVYKMQQLLLTDVPIPAEILKTSGKISRGENYIGLPWLVLDYPRCFVKDNIFAVRTMFWWGRFFSTTLHVSGKWQQYITGRLLKKFATLKENGFALNSFGDEWMHDTSHNTYIPLKGLTAEVFEEKLHQAAFVKIAAYTDIKEIDKAPEIWMRQFKVLIEAVQ